MACPCSDFSLRTARSNGDEPFSGSKTRRSPVFSGLKTSVVQSPGMKRKHPPLTAVGLQKKFPGHSA